MHTFNVLCILLLKQIFLSLSYICHISNMRFSDLVSLKEGVFQLREGHGQWNPELCETVVILFASLETELAAKSFEDNEEVL